MSRLGKGPHPGDIDDVHAHHLLVIWSRRLCRERRTLWSKRKRRVPRRATWAERLPFACSASVASLGLVVVITHIGLRVRSVSPHVAQALGGAASLSLLVCTTLAGVLLSRPAPQAQRAASG
jgi:hypothetical protein